MPIFAPIKLLLLNKKISHKMMGINLIDFVKSQIGHTVTTKAAGLLEEKEAAMQKALDILLPSVLGGMVNQATTLSGADNLLGFINQGGFDGNLFNSLSSLLGTGSETQGLLKKGSPFVHTLFGKKVGDITQWVATQTGIKTGSATNLLYLAAPILLSAVSKNIYNNPTATSLVSLLGSQIPMLKNAIPATLLPILGLTQLKLDSPPPNISQKSILDIPKSLSASDEKPLPKRLLPWIALLAAALIGLYFFRIYKTPLPDVPTTTPVIDSTMTALPPVPIATVTNDKILTLADSELKVKTGSFLDLLYTTITDANADLSKSIILDNVNFEKYKTELTDSSKIQLDDVAKILTAFPNVEIKINGYTDSRGDASENKELSRGRAASVKLYLASKGITRERLTSEGFGQADPIDDNDTEAGRAKNRRIEAVVTKK